jgi:carboxymethylenebutenolidase
LEEDDVGATLQWRSEPERTAQRYGRRIRFGNLRDKATAYMSFSQRVGPGVLVLHDEFGPAEWLEALADELTAEGFTVLVPDLYGGARPATVDDALAAGAKLGDERTIRLLDAAADHLTDNWHPRLGVIGFSVGADLAAAVGERHALDATALFYPAAAGVPSAPTVLHACEEEEAVEPPEGELFVHAAGRHFANPNLSAFDATCAADARAATIDFFRYHLS